ncbi:DUF962 domain-containing protein [Oligoflexus tunisiensis]|uniref:DUF962 domain-containing protein n=1 Tax=Oligoflexus tunisiensis TaxID=708132 RepID=UPI00114D3C17|nr:DUF962 domain-containing protein [Oligoflexus tunisiensis]
MKEKRITSFAEFWPFYMSQHADPRCRALHYAGTVISAGLLIGGIVSGNGLLCLAAIPAGYGPAWIGHFLIEKNRPATFQYPFYSLAADYVMAFRFITGRLGPHIPVGNR